MTDRHFNDSEKWGLYGLLRDMAINRKFLPYYGDGVEFRGEVVSVYYQAALVRVLIRSPDREQSHVYRYLLRLLHPQQVQVIEVDLATALRVVVAGYGYASDQEIMAALLGHITFKEFDRLREARHAIARINRRD